MCGYTKVLLIEPLPPSDDAFPAEHSVLIIDNVNLHRNTAVKDACDTAGVMLLYLPPYSPDLNPIEPTFYCLKQWMRRIRDYALRYDNLEAESKFSAFLISACEDFTATGNHKGLWKDAQDRFE